MRKLLSVGALLAASTLALFQPEPAEAATARVAVVVTHHHHRRHHYRRHYRRGYYGNYR